jgi:hypothetical protein
VMYIVFFCFFTKLYLRMLNIGSKQWTIISIKWFFFFYKNLFYLALNKIFNVYRNKIKKL